MNDNQNLDKSTAPETKKFLEWYKSEVQKGLQDIKFFVQGVDGATVEAFFGEVNRAISAEELSDPEFF